MANKIKARDYPEILAPAGDEDCFLAALAAGADAIYLGLKSFSARMEAENFTLEQLARLTDLAHAQDCRCFVALNVMLKAEELEDAFKLTLALGRDVNVDGLIIQDLAMPQIIQQAAFKGTVVYSTLANVSTETGLKEARALGADRVVIPRELSYDEMRALGEACPDGLTLEAFVHGALCYCVSGRCYWSSYMGGKSGLRGRCVQPCRRLYSKSSPSKISQIAKVQPKKSGERFFSCQDLELGEIVKLLLQVPHLESWKIEGRKKGPHYVYHTVTAYKILRDFTDDPQKRKLAMEILDLALGRPGVKGRFLPQKKLLPMAPGKQTASGKLAGHVKISQNRTCILKPHFQLLPKDYLRIGTQDERWHSLLPVNSVIPKGGTLTLKIPAHKTPKDGTPVFLVDRREPALQQLLSQLKAKAKTISLKKFTPVAGEIRLPQACGKQKLPDMLVSRGFDSNSKQIGCLAKNNISGLWLKAKAERFAHKRLEQMAFWLPPVLWPDNEKDFSEQISSLEREGAKCFVCNAPWQISLFKAPQKLELIAGPFCNTANGLALQTLKEMGFKAAFVSPELSASDLLALPKTSPLPLGLVLGAFWPVGLSRFGLAGIDVNEPFTSPMGETFWARNYGGLIWLFPSWNLMLCEQKKTLSEAGYSFFAWLEERPPNGLPQVSRPGLFNWTSGLK